MHGNKVDETIKQKCVGEGIFEEVSQNYNMDCPSKLKNSFHVPGRT